MQIQMILPLRVPYQMDRPPLDGRRIQPKGAIQTHCGEGCCEPVPLGAQLDAVDPRHGEIFHGPPGVASGLRHFHFGKPPRCSGPPIE